MIKGLLLIKPPVLPNVGDVWELKGPHGCTCKITAIFSVRQPDGRFQKAIRIRSADDGWRGTFYVEHSAFLHDYTLVKQNRNYDRRRHA